MGGQVNNYNFGGEGVNIVKDPLQMADGEASQLQNAELVPDQARGGQGSLSKRGGLLALTSALAGSILGIIALPLQTTYVRTMYVGLGSVASNTMVRTTDGTTFTPVTTPLRPARTGSKYYTPHAGQTALGSCERRGVSYQKQIFYCGDDYTVGTTAPPIVMWNGTDALESFRVPVGQNSDGTPPTVVTDMLAANSKIYFSVVELAVGTSSFHAGRVMEFDPRTNTVRQVANAVGVQTGEVNDNAAIPTCLAWYQGRLWMGLHASNSGSADVGAVYWCYPDFDIAWTVDVTNLNGKPNSLCEFKGNLYAATSFSDNIGTISKRTVGTGVWTDVDTLASADYSHIREFGGALYAVRYSDNVADTVDIITSTDGTTWSVSRDIYGTDTGSTKVRPTGALVFGSDLFYAFHPLSAVDTGTDGFIMRLRSGTWSKIYTGNVSGPLMALVERT